MMVKKDNMVMSSVIMGMSKTAYKTRRMESSSIDTSLYVNTPGITQCPHCQTSFCPPLKISFQYHFPMSENISHGLISFSNPGGRHFIKVTHMRTYLVSGVRPPGFDLLLEAKLHIPANLPTGNATVHLPK